MPNNPPFNGALRVLLVDDSPSDAKLVVAEIRRSGHAVEFERVEDADAMRAALRGNDWDLVICDWSMPNFSARQALSVLKETGIDLPFIIVSGALGEDLAVEAMRAGAHDYLLKDKLARLAPAIEREVRERQQREAHREETTALRASEAKVNQQEARFRAIVENNVDGIGLTSLEGTILYVSPATTRIYGRESEAMLGTHSFDYVHPDDLAVAREHNRLARESPGRHAASERRIIRPDGTIRWVEVKSINLLDDPAVGAVVANIRDVTERKEAEAALRASEARFSRLSESGILGVIFGDIDSGAIVDANDTFLRSVGYSRQELEEGKLRFRDLSAPESWEATDRGVAELRACGVATPYEKEYLRKDGSRLPILIGIAMVGKTRSIAFMVDLTLQKRAEEALKNSELQLRQAQKMEAIGRLAGGVAHDFNNILSVVLSYCATLALDLDPGDPMLADVQEIEKAGQRAAALTRQLLMFSRQEVAEPRVINLNEVLTNMDKMLQRILGEDVELLSLADPALGQIRVDPSHVEQVIMNLVVNSRDAMPTGGKLTIETRNVILDEAHAKEHLGVKPGAYVMLAVSDTGTGMEPATQARIFEPFFTTKEQGKGTGLGLSTVFGIVQQCGGSIWVYSEPGQGTTFKVYLPRVDAQAEAIAMPSTPANLNGTETILLVEDEDQIRMVARLILHKQGYQVLEAKNAADALLQSANFAGTIHLLLTDVVMPQMSGPELAKRLLLERPGLKVLCMSGYTDDALVRHGALEAGIGYLQKPITPSRLSTKVRQVLDRGTLVAD